MIKQIEFIPQVVAEGLEPKDNWALISICDDDWKYGQSHPEFANLKRGWKNIIRLNFHDVDEGGLNYTLFSDKDAKNIIEFLKRIEHSNVTVLLIHCHAGISRSAAVAKFAAEFYDNELFDMKYKDYSLYNKHVYSLLRKVYFEEMFTE